MSKGEAPGSESQDVKRVIGKYEECIDSQQKEIEFYREENQRLRENIEFIVEENNRLSSEAKIRNVSQEDIFKGVDNERQIHTAALMNLKSQVDLLKEEKNDLETLWTLSKDTVTNLEKEIIEYRKLLNEPNSIISLKKEYSRTIRFLEEKIANLQRDLEAERSLSSDLQLNKDELSRRIEVIELRHSTSQEELAKTELFLKKTKEEIVSIMKDRLYLEKNLHQSYLQAREYADREIVALAKVQEALNIAECAIADKGRAMAKEDEMREEYDKLASEMKRVITEAAAKVQEEISRTKSKYMEKIKSLESSNQKTREQLAQEVRKSATVEKQMNQLEEKLRDVMQNNTALDTDLRIASQSIIEMEVKLEAFQKLLNTGQKTTMICEERTKELENFLDHQRKLKEQWKNVVNEVTVKLQMEISNLQRENASLAAENSKLRQKMDG
ncbi:restin homolog [Phlebotomus argentipes]|uniref:restin homolog n=1 Tax=Phlebotomus argentipes TaxID=94469 RepID=UPI00289300FC|nr:restin homolog [Phlebotomus argentipes]